ncbi:kinase-like domain-containing protein [Melanogaster broomeanus]|nr:kinase-like domain-containing protein [Melanogaster broomeanus]
MLLQSKYRTSLPREGNDPIASGGYGDVYRGTFRVNGRSIDVAVKAIRTYSADDGDYAQKKKRLRREIGVWLGLKHINIVPLFGTTMDFGRFPAMVCPWLENGQLSSYLERQGDSLTTGERLVLLNDVAVGLQYLHSQSVVHGDLSGSNVLIDDKGRACIGDFGLSMLLTELGGQGGTLRWAAPENLYLNIQHPEDRENVLKVSPTTRSDVYSFGRIMLQVKVLTGKIPYHYFPADPPVVLAISRGETPWRPNLAEITDRRWAFIQRCWSTMDEGQSRPLRRGGCGVYEGRVGAGGVIVVSAQRLNGQDIIFSMTALSSRFYHLVMRPARLSSRRTPMQQATPRLHTSKISAHPYAFALSSRLKLPILCPVLLREFLAALMCLMATSPVPGSMISKSTKKVGKLET